MNTHQPKFHSGDSDKPHVQIGKVNRNHQICLGTRKAKSPNKPEQDVYAMFCLCCGHLYGANGFDVWLRLCAQCQGGEGEDLSF